MSEIDNINDYWKQAGSSACPDCATEQEHDQLERAMQEGEEWLAARQLVTTRKDMLQGSLNAVQGRQSDCWHALRNLEGLMTIATLLVNALDHLEAVEQGGGL